MIISTDSVDRAPVADSLSRHYALCDDQIAEPLRLRPPPLYRIAFFALASLGLYSFHSAQTLTIDELLRARFSHRTMWANVLRPIGF